MIVYLVRALSPIGQLTRIVVVDGRDREIARLPGRAAPIVVSGLRPGARFYLKGLSRTPLGVVLPTSAEFVRVSTMITPYISIGRALGAAQGESSDVLATVDVFATKAEIEASIAADAPRDEDRNRGFLISAAALSVSGISALSGNYILALFCALPGITTLASSLSRPRRLDRRRPFRYIDVTAESKAS